MKEKFQKLQLGNVTFIAIISVFFVVILLRKPNSNNEALEFLMDLFSILFTTKVLGLISKKIKIPAVVGALIAGLLFGPAGLNRLRSYATLITISELGVIVLMFTAGLEVDKKKLLKTGKSSFVIALFGVIVPLVLGTLLMQVFNNNGNFFSISYDMFLKNIFIGVVLTATSVSITAAVLKELGVLSTRTGTTIMGAALIDDILGIVILTIVTSLVDTDISIIIVLLKIVAFFIFVILIGILTSKVYSLWMMDSETGLRRHVIFSFCLCLLLAYVSEHIFGVADITGAFCAGVILSSVSKERYLEKRFDILSYMLLSPVFFASIGLKVDMVKISTQMIIFTVLLISLAFISKIIGCYVAAKSCKFTKKESTQIAIGMMARGEVALIIANKGAEIGLMDAVYFTPLVIMVISAAVITPILLKVAFSTKEKNEV